MGKNKQKKTKENMEKEAKILKDLRREIKWTQKDLSIYLNVSLKTINNWEQCLCQISGTAKVLVNIRIKSLYKEKNNESIPLFK